ncbi:MAG: carbohydrate ABC transporter substrate-binding protein [Phascolarctobacterium sp.]
MLKKSLLCLLVLVALLVGACGSKEAKQEQRPITVYLFTVEMLRDYAPYIQEQLPDVPLQFVVGNNDLDFYKFLKEQGSLPDIFTNRRFALHDAAELREQLLDVSRTNAAASIYAGFLDNYKNEDGSINWLPLCGEPDGLVANKALFAKYNIPLPHDYASFRFACQEFAKHGIRGFVSDFYYDYTPMEILQGLSIPQLQSREGQKWRFVYENPKGNQRPGLDDKIWPRAFERMENFIKDTGLEPGDVDYEYNKVMHLFTTQKAAMARFTGPLALQYAKEFKMDLVFLPYFGQDGGNDWLLTYPFCQIALNKNLEKDAKRKEQAMRVLNVMLSEGGQRIIAQRNDVIAYSRNTKLELNPVLDSIRPFIEANLLYLRLASNDFFAGSKLVVDKMLRREINAKQAYEEMDTFLRKPKEQTAEKAAVFAKGYDFVFHRNGGNQAGSAMTTTLAKVYDAEIVIAAGYSYTSPVHATSYSPKQLQYLIMPNSLESFTKEMTGEEIAKLLRIYVEGSKNVEPTTLVQPFNKTLLPITAGLEYVAEEGKQGFKLKGITQNGKTFDLKKKYKVTVLDKETYFRHKALELYHSVGESAFVRGKEFVRPNWLRYFKDGQQLAEPTNYVKVE